MTDNIRRSPFQSKHVLMDAVTWREPVGAIQALLERGADINERDSVGSTVLIHAICLKEFAAAHFLIDAGARLDERNNPGFTALLIASIHGYTDIVRHLLEKGADPTIEGPRGFNALMEAEKHHHPETAQVLKEAAKIIAARESHATASNRQERLKQHVHRLYVRAAKP